MKDAEEKDLAEIPLGGEGWRAMFDLFREILHDDVSCPACSGGVNSVFWMTLHLNDDHEYSREQVADWLDTLGALNGP